MSGVLISGITTPLGTRLAQRLVEAGCCTVVGAGVEPWEQVRGGLPPEVEYHCVDLTRPRVVRRLLFGPAREHGVEALVHLALHRAAADTGRRVHQLNVEATRLMLRLAEEHPSIRRFILRSSAGVYQQRADTPDLVREDHPIELSAAMPQWIRDRVEADVTVCTRMGLSPLHVNVLRCAEIFAPRMGSQLYDYLQSRVCLRPLGFDPILNLLSLEDAAAALQLALVARAPGVVNIPGADTLTLTTLIRRWGRDDVPVPSLLLEPLYRARARVRHTEFRYGLNVRRFHYNKVLDGARAREVLGYVPANPIAWPYPV